MNKVLLSLAVLLLIACSGDDPPNQLSGNRYIKIGTWDTTTHGRSVLIGQIYTFTEDSLYILFPTTLETIVNKYRTSRDTMYFTVDGLEGWLLYRLNGEMLYLTAPSLGISYTDTLQRID